MTTGAGNIFIGPFDPAYPIGWYGGMTLDIDPLPQGIPSDLGAHWMSFSLGNYTQTWNIVYNTFKEYYEPLIAARRAQPTDDITSLIANGKVFGSPMEERAMISYLIIASTAGHDTTSATTAITLLVPMSRPTTKSLYSFAM
jgi:hypothetical protein